MQIDTDLRAMTRFSASLEAKQKEVRLERRRMADLRKESERYWRGTEKHRFETFVKDADLQLQLFEKTCQAIKKRLDEKIALGRQAKRPMN